MKRNWMSQNWYKIDSVNVALMQQVTHQMSVELFSGSINWYKIWLKFWRLINELWKVAGLSVLFCRSGITQTYYIRSSVNVKMTTTSTLMMLRLRMLLPPAALWCHHRPLGVAAPRPVAWRRSSHPAVWCRLCLLPDSHRLRAPTLCCRRAVC